MRYVVLALSSLCGFTMALAQSSSQAPLAASSHSTHGLVLTVSRDQTPEPADSAQLKACLAHNPSLACAPLSVTLKNEGKEALLSYSATCGWNPFTIDLRNPDGSWEAFPSLTNNSGWVCQSTVGAYSVIWPGRSYAFRARLADLSLGLDTAFPAASPNATSNPPFRAGVKGYALLAGPDPRIIRVHQRIQGCVASNEVLEGEAFEPGNPFLPSSKCLGGQWLKQSIDLQSNELQLTPGPAPR